MSSASATEPAGWSETDTTVPEVERRLLALRRETDEAGRRTTVMTHIAWVPHGWEQAASDTLSGLQERHPSRTILLLPDADDRDDAIDADVALRCFSLAGQERTVCSEVIVLRLRGRRAAAPASIVSPLLIADLHVFLRWRGRPDFGDAAFQQLVELVDRLIVDSTEWPDVPTAYAPLADVFERAAVSDIAWQRTERWRRQLASLWPNIGGVKQIRVRGTAAQAHLLAGWLRSRLDRGIELEHESAERLERVDVDGAPAPFPPGDPPHPSDVLSDQLDQFGRDPIYEAAVRAA